MDSTEETDGISFEEAIEDERKEKERMGGKKAEEHTGGI